jgi:hypothetical protein
MLLCLRSVRAYVAQVLVRVEESVRRRRPSSVSRTKTDVRHNKSQKEEQQKSNNTPSQAQQQPQQLYK